MSNRCIFSDLLYKFRSLYTPIPLGCGLYIYAREILDAAVAPYLALEVGESRKGGNRESML